MRYEYTLTAADQSAYVYFHAIEGNGARAVRETFRKSARAVRRVCLMGAVLVGLFALLLVVRPGEGRTAFGHPAFPALLAVVFAWMGFRAANAERMEANIRRVVKTTATMALPNRFLGAMAATLDGENLVVEQEFSVERLRRGAADRIDEAPSHFFVTLGNSNGFAIPKRGKSEVEVGEMRGALRAWSGMEVGVVKTELPEFG